MIFAKIKLTIAFEMNMPLEAGKTLDELKAQIEAEGGTQKIVDGVSSQIVNDMQSPFTSGKITDGSCEIVEV